MEAAHIRWRPLGRLLVEQGLLSEDQLEHALEEQASTGRRLGETLVSLGLVSHAALSHALAEQYGFEPKTETGFGTGLRREIERRYEREREEGVDAPTHGAETAPLLKLVREPEEPARQEARDPDDENVYLAQLEEQWAKLAAAEEQLAEAERALATLRQRAGRRRDQVVRLVERVRRRDRRIAELSATARPVRHQQPPSPARGHLVYAPAGGRYVLVEREGGPPEPEATLELPELGQATFVVGRVGRSPLPNDPRPCVFAQHVS